MMESVYLTIGILSGIAVGYLLRRTVALQQADAAEKKVKDLIFDGQEKERKLLLSARDKALKVIDEAKREETQRRQELSRLRGRLEKREEIFDKKFTEIEKNEKQIEQENQKIVKVKEEINAETLRKHLLDKHGVGIIAVKDKYIRIAFSCVEESDITKLFDIILQGIRELGTVVK